MKQVRVWWGLLAVGLLCGALILAQGPSVKEQKIRKIIELKGKGTVSLAALDAAMAEIVRSRQAGPPNLGEKFVTAFTLDTLTALAQPIYDKNFTEKEIGDLLAFYQTETGKKVITVMPQVTLEIREAAAVWGRRFAQQLMEKLKEKGK